MNAGDTAWVLASTALVLLMTPGLAFFYGGLVRKKNVLSVLMQCFFLICLISLQWVLFGYSLAFGPTRGGVIGGLDWAGLRGVGAAPFADYAGTIPHQLFMAFQMMFAIITPALMIGAFAERIRFSGFMVLMILWSTLIYDPLAHWVWGNGGWLKNLGTLDFAGGTVVPVKAGVAALVVAVLIGKREGIRSPRSPHNLPFCVLGAGLLWFGWFGFNAGSALAANGSAVGAFVTTNTAAAAAGLAWMVLDWWFNEIPTMLGVVTGLVAGLVAITPAAGFVSPLSAIAIGTGAGAICFYMVTKVKAALGYDDALDVFGVHGVGGVFGALATGLFAEKSIGGADGLFFGNPRQFLIQLLATGVTIVFTAAGTYILFNLVDLLVGIRVDVKEETMGLDLSQHHESGYTLVD
ncbi:MAG: ammonium transporter [Deltaproteobacteria bacterium]|nr:ammonium transporter [Deltaproteobacteria bacterium]